MCFALMCVCSLYLCLVSMVAEKGVGSPVTEVTNACDLAFGCWELNPGYMQEQPVLLFTSEPSAVVTFMLSTIQF